MTPQEINNNMYPVGSVIVTYHPELTTLISFKDLLNVVQHLVIVDNGSSKPVTDALETLSLDPRTFVIYNHENYGIAAALNQGCSYLKNKGYDYALLLDQDSIVPENMVSILYETAKRYKKSAIIAPSIIPIDIDEEAVSHKLRFLIRTKFLSFKKEAPYRDEMEVAMVITSGSLYDLNCWEKIGGFWEDLFIEGVDNEYCLRAYEHGYSVIVSVKAKLRQQYGAQRLVEFLGFNLFPTFHSPLRHYYVSRNRVHIWRRYWKSSLFYISWDIFSLLNSVFLIMVAEDKKLSKLKSIVQGTLDGLIRKTGRKIMY